MKKLPDRPGDVKVDAAHAATLVAARSVSSVAWEHDGERGHRRSLIQAFVGAIKDRVSKPPASFDPVCPGVEAFRRLGTCPSRRATHKRQRRPVAAHRRSIIPQDGARCSFAWLRRRALIGSYFPTSHGGHAGPPAFTYLMVMPRVFAGRGRERTRRSIAATTFRSTRNRCLKRSKRTPASHSRRRLRTGVRHGGSRGR